MSAATLQSPLPLSLARETPSADFIAALFSDGDSRIATDPLTGLNKYLCPRMPAPDLTCASSCTASPVSAAGFDLAFEAFSSLGQGSSPPRQQADRLAAIGDEIEARLLRFFSVAGLARVLLCPSGTDALLTAAMLIAAERPGKAITAILPAASETGTGVPLAAQCRVFDGAECGRPLTTSLAETAEIPLRSADGTPRSAAALNEAFAAATAAASGHPVVYLTHGSKTGLIAPVAPPSGADVIVDACQGRIAPQTVAAYLRRGWPVVITGSKFFGGPAFSGAVLFPRARLPADARYPSPGLGTVLRWTAALATINAFDPGAASVATTLSEQAAVIAKGFAANPALVPVSGLPAGGSGWAEQPSIFTFGMRDPRDQGRLLSVSELRLLYQRLAIDGILLGQPVSLGLFGGLRLAIGARDLLDRAGDGRLSRIFAALRAITADFAGREQA